MNAQPYFKIVCQGPYANTTTATAAQLKYFLHVLAEVDVSPPAAASPALCLGSLGKDSIVHQ